MIVTLLLCAALYLVGNARVSLWDRDEPRYAQASRQMLASGDWLVPMFLDDLRIKKPPLIYWCQATSMAIFHRVAPDGSLSIDQRMERDAAAARLPSSIAILLTLTLLAVVLKRIGGETFAFWSVLIFGTSGLVIMSAKMCLTDAVLLFFVTTSQLCLYAMYRRRASWGVVAAFGVSTGLGLLTKGPVVLGVNAMTLIVLGVLRFIDRRQSPERTAPAGPVRWLGVWFKVVLVLALVAAIVGPWVYMMQHRLSGKLADVVRHEVLERMIHPLEQHKGPPGYYLISIFATFLPWSLFLPMAIYRAWQDRRDPLVRFSFAAAVGPWLMFEVIQTKLPHYVLPCYPFLAILTARAFLGAAPAEWRSRAWVIGAGVWSLALVGMELGPWVAASPKVGFENLPRTAMVLVTVATIFFAVLVFVLFLRRRIMAAAYSMAAGMFVLFFLHFTLYLPRAPVLHLSERVGVYLQSIGADTKGEVYMIDYKEDSLPFYQGGTIRSQSKNTFLAVTPPEKWPTYLVITREIWNQTPPEARAHLEILKSIRGWAYAAKGRIVEVLVVRKK
jgi:4-amino-4-deoxy-L-arabinose transferase-like glycosyltransferase